MKLVGVVSDDEKARTGDVLLQCKNCNHALLVEGSNVEKGAILFCRKFFDFPVKFKRVVFIPSRVRFSFTEKFWCEEG